jgi:hypothetical protein
MKLLLLREISYEVSLIWRKFKTWGEMSENLLHIWRIYLCDLSRNLQAQALLFRFFLSSENKIRRRISENTSCWTNFSVKLWQNSNDKLKEYQRDRYFSAIWCPCNWRWLSFDHGISWVMKTSFHTFPWGFFTPERRNGCQQCQNKKDGSKTIITFSKCQSADGSKCSSWNSTTLLLNT